MDYYVPIKKAEVMLCVLMWDDTKIYCQEEKQRVLNVRVQVLKGEDKMHVVMCLSVSRITLGKAWQSRLVEGRLCAICPFLVLVIVCINYLLTQPST